MPNDSDSIRKTPGQARPSHGASVDGAGQGAAPVVQGRRLRRSLAILALGVLLIAVLPTTHAGVDDASLRSATAPTEIQPQRPWLDLNGGPPIACDQGQALSLSPPSPMQLLDAPPAAASPLDCAGCVLGCELGHFWCSVRCTPLNPLCIARCTTILAICIGLCSDTCIG